MTAVSRAMEQNWGSQNFYANYYPHDPSRSSDRPLNSPPGPAGGESGNGAGSSQHAHRRSFDQQTSHQGFLPPPPPHESSSHSHGSSMNLPPFSSTFYGGSYHSPTGSHPSGSTSAPMHMPHSMNYGSHVSMGAPSSYPYPVTSPMALPGTGLPRTQPGQHSYTESPRIPGYSSSPGTRHLSPTSPTTHLAPPGITQSTGSSSSSSFPSITRTPANLPKSKRRSGGSTHSNESWDEGKSGEGDDKEEHGEMPWGMPQDEYKALNPRDKKQVRNRIGARRFRAKRKDYVSNLEGTLREREDEISQLRAQVDSQRTEINELRHRLGMPMIPIPPAAGLGLVVESDAWPEAGSKGGRKGMGE